MDVLNLRVTKVKDARKQVVEIFVNNQNIIDLVREIEIPYAEKESHSFLAGEYKNIALRAMKPLSRHLLGVPKNKMYKYNDMVEIVSCNTCGGPWCWPLMVKIISCGKKVVWQKFLQPHRIDPKIHVVWDYSKLGIFEFYRKDYEQELKRIDDLYTR